MHIRKLVSGRYQCIIRLQGVSASKTFLDKQSAKIWGHEKELAIYSGTPIKRNNKDKLVDLITRYMSESVPHLKDHYNVNNQCKRLIKEYQWLVNKRLNRITPNDFELFKYERIKVCSRQTGFKNGFRATNKDLILFSTIFNKAINIWQYSIVNFPSKITKFPVSKGIYRPIKYYEHRELLKLANSHQKLVLLIARHTGMRPKEIFQLTWLDIDKERKKIIVRSNISKTNESREIDISNFLLKLIYKNKNDNSNYIISISRISFRFWFYRTVKSLNYKNLIFYNYRRQFVQRLADKGKTIPYIASQTGHSSWSMIARYYGHRSLRN